MANQPQPQTQSRPFFMHLIMLFLGALAVLYMLNPTLGIDLLPDNLPLLGNMDEGGAMILLLGVMRYYGLDLTGIFGPRIIQRQNPPPTSAGQKRT
jgi:hypothetical protein